MTASDEVDRILRLLDVGIDAVRKGDGATALMATEQALQAAKRLPQKPSIIALPDRSGERLP